MKRNEEGGTPIAADGAAPVQGAAEAPPTVRGKLVSRPMSEVGSASGIEVRAGGVLDNLGSINLGRFVAIIQEGAAAAQTQDWFGLLRLAGELAQMFGALGRAGGPADAPEFPKMAAIAAGADFAAFDKAAEQFEQARGNVYAVPPAKTSATGDGSAPAIAFDPATILVALELFSKIVGALREWRKRTNP